MSVWAGWQDDLLSHAAGIPDTAANRRFLTEWHKHAESDCRNNPVDLSVKVAASANCHKLPGSYNTAQSYPTSGDAVHAFTEQIHETNYRPLLLALESGDPYALSQDGVAKVASALGYWGSHTFSQVFYAEEQPAGGGGVPTKGIGGYNHFARSLSRTLPTELRRAHLIRAQALRRLHVPRKLGG